MLEIVYTGSIEATMEEMRRMLILAHSLYISVPVTIIVVIYILQKAGLKKVPILASPKPSRAWTSIVSGTFWLLLPP